MERLSEKPINRTPFIALGLMLVFAVLGTVLFLGHGMDTDRFFVAINAESCAFVLSLSFPVFIGLEFISMLVNEGANFSLWPWEYEKRAKDVKVSAAFTLIGLIAGVYGYLAFQNANPPLCISLTSLSCFLGAAVYFGLLAYRGYVQSGVRGKAFLTPVLYEAVLFALEVAILWLIYQKSTDFAMLMVGYPLVFLTSALAFREG